MLTPALAAQAWIWNADGWTAWPAVIAISEAPGFTR